MEFLTEIRQATDLTKLVKILYYSEILLRNFFLSKFFIPLFLQNLRQFLENWIFDGNLTGADLTKISENFVLS